MFGKKKLTGALAFVASTAIALAVAASAWAADDVPVTTFDNVEIIKTINASKQIDTKDDVFKFTFTALGVEDSAGTLIIDSTAAGYVDPRSMPTTSKSVTAAAMSGDTQTLTAEGLTFNGSFPHAGVYEYTLAEANNSPADKEITFDSSTYKMRVYVENTTDDKGDNTLKIARVTFADEDGTKVSPSFTNTYTDKAGLVVKKTVSGTYADETKDFTFSVTITVPSWVTADVAASYTATTTDGEKITFTVAKGETAATATGIKLHDAQTLAFANNTLPVGTTYSVTETGEQGYTPSAKTYTDTALSTGEKSVTAGTAATDYTVKNSDTVVTTTGAATNVINTYTPVTPTGILISNLPYILLIGIPVAALVAWLVIRGKRYSQAA